jgi:membrane protein implicated in regulation of membrane protease activity
MDFSLIDHIGSIFSIAVPTVAAILAIVRWYRKRLKQTEAIAERMRQLVGELIDVATTPTRRADIHAYVLFESTRIEARQGRAATIATAAIGGMIWLSLQLAFMSRFLDISAHEWAYLFVWASIIATFITLLVAQFFEYQVRRIDREWLNKVSEKLFYRAYAHADRKRECKAGADHESPVS